MSFNSCRGVATLGLLIACMATSPLFAVGNGAPDTDKLPATTAAEQQLANTALADQLQAMTQLQASFTQRVSDSAGELVDESSGWMAWQHPDRFRWEVLNPMTQSILIDGQQYYQYDRDLDQLLVQPLADDVAVLPRLLLSGSATEIEQSFLVEPLPAESGAQYYRLQSREHSALFSEVEIQFVDGRLTGMQVVDELGQRTEFLFGELNAELPKGEALYQLDPAPGTDVIYQ